MAPKFKLTGIVLTVVALVTVFGCSLGNKKVSAPPTSSPEPAFKSPPRVTIAFTPSHDPKKDLEDAIKRLATAYPYRLTFYQRIGDHPPAEYFLEYAAANRFHFRDSYGGESFKIGDAAYSKFPPSQPEWVGSGDGESMGEQQEKTVQKNLPANVRDAKATGKEALNGVECYVYTFSKVVGSPPGKAWIRPDGLPYQISEESKTFKQHYRFEYVDVVDVHNPMR